MSEQEGPLATDETAGQDDSPQPDQALLSERDALGIRTQRSWDYEHVLGSLAETRKALANEKVGYQVALRVGIEGVHPEQVKKGVHRLVAQAELLEGFLASGELPMPPVLEVAGGIEVPKSKRGRVPLPPPDVA